MLLEDCKSDNAGIDENNRADNNNDDGNGNDVGGADSVLFEVVESVIGADDLLVGNFFMDLFE